MSTASTTVTTLAGLHAVTREIDGPGDVLSSLGPDGVAWLHDGASFATAGTVAHVRADDAVALLASVDHDPDPRLPGAGPRAVGALAFDPEARTELVVPARIVGRTADGRGWVTELGDGRHIDAAPAVDDGPSRFTVSARMSKGAWRAAVLDALGDIESGELVKVVLSRAVEVIADRPFDRRAILTRLRAQQPGCFVYAAGGMVGASPELLLARSGSTVVSRPLAGTAILGDHDIEELRVSAKNMWEHRLVVDEITTVLEKLCEHLDAASEPEVDAFTDVAHLATPIYGTLREPAPDAIAIVRALHPTPAVAGTPTATALASIARLEPDPRGRYAGPVGWVDANGDGEWAMALRGAALDGPGALLHAGAGIVAGSDPDAEWSETEAKLQPMLAALIRP
jgi:menaquinone-specific isochorismate synthase